MAELAQALLDLIHARYSPKAFSTRPIPEPVLTRMFEAARWAPSSYNRQPWRFLVTRRGTEAYDRLMSCLYEGNQARAQGAPVLVLAAAVEADERGPNRYAWHDLGMACAFLTLEAVAHGVYPRFMAGFDKDRARRLFDIPEPMAPSTVIVLGYPAENAPTPRVRRPLEEIVYEARWGEAFTPVWEEEPAASS